MTRDQTMKTSHFKVVVRTMSRLIDMQADYENVTRLVSRVCKQLNSPA